MSADPTDKRIKFKPKDGYIDKPINVPCGKCIGCKKRKSNDWAIRCMHEADIHAKNCVVTLTYDDKHLPLDRSVKKGEVSYFLKQLRKKIAPKRCRFFACGEYGDKNHRPHYHIMLFGYDFPDKMFCGKSDKGSMQYRSEFLEKIWVKGYSSIGDLTYSSARYIAGYLQKKLDIHELNDEKYIIWPNYNYAVSLEFCLMSRRPGIGSYWYEKFESDCKKDYLIIDGVKTGVPKYYRDKMKITDEKTYEKNRIERRAHKQNTYEENEREEKFNLELTKLRQGALNA